MKQSDLIILGGLALLLFTGMGNGLTAKSNTVLRNGVSGA